MIAIYASKLFKISTRKDKIISTMNDPINSELVTQLKSYLDEEYQTPEYLGGTPEVDVPEGFEDNLDFGDSDESGESSGGPAPGGGSSFSGGGSFSSPSSFDTDFDSGSFEDDADVSNDAPISDSNTPGLVVEEDESSGDIEESTKLRFRNNTIYASTLSSSELSILQGTLNSREDTQGAVRANIDEDELWIYYSDSINLNNVMEPIISMITTHYKNLKFNRLARTDNAIVFQIDSAPSMLIKTEE